MAVSKIKVSDAAAQVLADNLIEYNLGQSKCPIPAGSEIQVDDSAVFEQYTRHPNRRLLAIGAFTHVVEAGDDFFMMQTGRYCSIARGTRVVNGHHPLHSVTTNPWHYAEYYRQNLPEHLRYEGPVENFQRSYGRGQIGNDVWLGAHCILRSGISIGDGAVIASGSVLTKDVAPYTIVGGNPAVVIRERFPGEVIERFLALQWWNYSPESFRDIDMFKVTAFLDEMERRHEAGDLTPFQPRRFKFSLGTLKDVT